MATNGRVFTELDVHTGAVTDVTPPRWLAKPVLRSRDRHARA